MVVRVLRIMVLNSAGNVTRGECRDVSAEKTRRVKLFRARCTKFILLGNFRNARPAGLVRKFQLRRN
jgi:hypothetical protein